MTPQEYQDKIDEKQAEISALTPQITSLKAKAASEDVQAEQWAAQANKDCSGGNNKKAACEEDKRFKAAKAKAHTDLANSYRAQIGVLTTKINTLNGEINILIREKEAAATTSNQVTIELGKQGLTRESVLARAEGEAHATEIAATAKADAITADANAAASNKRVIGYVIGGILAVVIVWGIVKIIKRRKKGK